MENPIGKLLIKNLNESIFVVPHYQRGYRWTKTEAKHLFDDLLEFAVSGEKEYCLQPIALQEITLNPEEYQIFSQTNDQTVLRIVDGQQRLTTMAILLRELEINPKWDIYYLAESKTLSELLKENAATTINDYFRNEVRKTFQAYPDTDKNKLKSLLSNSEKNITFLRYDIDKEEDGHDAFMRLNAGKTPLTSSELIRALYMVNASGLSVQQRMEISKEWELIENTLNKDQFWLMFNAKGLNDTPTRIDLLFALVMKVSLKDTKANPRIVFERMDDNSLDLDAVWQDVLRCFWWMQSCYDDIELFNYLGWINEFTDISASTIYDNYRKYPAKNDFKKSIIGIIQEKYANETLEGFTYACDKTDLRALLVLLNVLECNKCKERFRFDLYSNENWDIEHIDSQTENELKDPADQQEWLRLAYAEMTDENKRSCNELLTFAAKQDFIVNKLFNDSNISDKDGIGNLALLASHINRGYKNAIFPVKRRWIIDAVRNGSSFVPPCTKNAFMKFYTKSASNITKWQKEDFDNYRETMKQYFNEFQELDTQLPPPQEPDDKKHIKYGTATDGCINNENVGGNEDASILRPSEFNFTDFMTQYHHIVIPKIQRIYVQGRPDSYGKKCLSNFAQALVDSVKNHTPLSLDLIYGINANDEFQPLDGQQRLTTLLLLAWLCGKYKKTWNFKYDSRRATECFIEGLLKHEPPAFDNTAPNACSSYIKASDWFLAAWEKDAGIAGMLAMLDSLYEKLHQEGSSTFDLSVIKFCVNYLNTSVKSYDQIFLKMNSRGKELTVWENIKAVLDQYVPDDLAKNWKEKLNNTWQERLWKKLDDTPEKINKLDTTMLSVVELALACVGYQESVKDNTFQLAQWLENPEHEEGKREFYELGSMFFSALEDNEYTPEIQQALTPSWAAAACIPDFKDDSSGEFYKSLLAFYAARKSQNMEWMRVVWNIAENCGLHRGNFSSAYKLIHNLSAHANDILAFIANDENQITSNFAQVQIREEREKAKKIIDIPNGQDWKDAIIEAETHPLLHGSIGALLWDDGTSLDDWGRLKNLFLGKFPNDCNDVNLLRRGQEMLYYGDYSIQEGRNWVFGTNLQNWEKLLHAPDGQTYSRVRPVLWKLLKAEAPQTYTAKDWQFYFIKYHNSFLKNCACYRWNDACPFLIQKMTSTNLHAWNCNPFLDAIANNQDDRFHFWVCARTGDGKIHVNDNVSMWIDCSPATENYASTVQFLVERSSGNITTYPVDLSKDIIEQGRNLLKKLCEEAM